MGGRRDQLIAMADAALLAQCVVDRLRGPGPGGQKRNKTESSVRLRHGATGLAALAGESRSQPENKLRALLRLRERFAFDLREEIVLDDYQPTAALAALLAQEPVRKSEKWLRSPEYLRAVGDLVDLYQAAGCSLPEVARRATASQSRLDRLARVDPRLARKLGELRSAQRGKPVV
jgi:hypothetical protein